MNIRFINRDGKMILQHRSPCDFKGTNPPFKIEEVWTDVPTHQESKKVTVADELTAHFDSKGALLTPYGYAVSAIEFFKKRISGLPATQALRQCEQALFGEA